MTTELSTGDDLIRENILQQEDHAASLIARQRLAELCASLGLPQLPEFTSADVTPEIIKAAIEDQIRCVEERVPKMKGATLKKWKNRQSMVMPLYFHTPFGREAVRRLVFSGRFGFEEMSLILGCRSSQLNDYVNGQGWTKQVVAIKREQEMAEWSKLNRHLAMKGKNLVIGGAIAALEELTNGPSAAREMLQDPRKLMQLHEVIEAVVPSDKDGPTQVNYEGLPTVQVGVQVISHQAKPFDPVEASKKARAAEISPKSPQEIESE